MTTRRTLFLMVIWLTWFGLGGIVCREASRYTIGPYRWLILALLGLALLPMLLSSVLSILIARQSGKLRFVFPLPTNAARSWIQAADLWEYEARRADRVSDGVSDQAVLLGFMASMILQCGFLLQMTFVQGALRFQELDSHRHPWQLGILVTATTVAATGASYLLSFTQILVRISDNDGSGKMFAWATKRLLVVSVASALFGSMLLSNAAELQGVKYASLVEAVLVGLTVALLGDRAVKAITDRAGALLGIADGGGASTDLLTIDGLGAGDIARLLEEGVDSVHALAHYPTARLFFSTPYSLQRIVNWQDQALLFAIVGSAKAELFRTELVIRGAIEGRTYAERTGAEPPAISVPDWARTSVPALQKSNLAPILEAYRDAIPALIDESRPATSVAAAPKLAPTPPGDPK